MFRVLLLTLCLGAGPAAAACRHTADMPPIVLSLREAMRTREQNVALADAWRRYLDGHKSSAFAHVQYARAIRYSKPDNAEQVRLVGRALKIDPDCAAALAEMAQIGGPPFEPATAKAESARKMALRAIELEPDWYDPHVTLLGQSLILGDEAGATEQLRAMLRKRGFPSPLLDYAYNLLWSAPPGALVLTNGDNDTFPLLALQAIHGVRRDVRVVNLSLLNLETYAKAVLVRPEGSTWTDADIESTHRPGDPPPMLRTMAELCRRSREGRLGRPLYIATTVPRSLVDSVCHQRLEIVGLLYRVQGEPGDAQAEPDVDGAKLDSLLTQVFRLESATDFGYAWGEESSLSYLMLNYVGLYLRAARDYAATGDLLALRRMLRGGLTLLRAHPELQKDDKQDQLRQMVEYWKEVDPHNPEIEAWSRAANAGRR